MKTNRVILFDMDGTLTKPRHKIDDEMLELLALLSVHAKIGIVTGSDFNLCNEQCGKYILTKYPGDFELLPCNGTQRFKPFVSSIDGKAEWVVLNDVNILDYIDQERYNSIVTKILMLQAAFIEEAKRGFDWDVPATGTFVSFRGSTINWSLLGRQYFGDKRYQFENHPAKEKLRRKYFNLLVETIDKQTRDVMEFSLGGETGIDIYPIGWDKTYALRYYKDKEVWFIGDRCEKEQNDYHIYQALIKEKRAFKVSSPEMTKLIIRRFLEKMNATKI